jgi:hypothetical protein
MSPFSCLSNSTGLIDLTVYYSSTTATSTTAGGVLGDIDETEVEQGQTGTAIVLEQIQYVNYSATVNSITVTVNPIATDEVYRNTNTTGGETTSYSYTWFSSSTVIQSETVTEPTITSGENGPGTADSEVTFFDSLRRPIWHKDGDGYLTYIAYDQATSAVVKTIADVNTADTGDFSNLPSGWSTPSGGGLELITQMTVDSLGRVTELTDPNGNITYTVYIDTNQQKNVYPGWNSSTDLPTGPTQVYREDLGGSYSETLTMSRCAKGSGVGSLQANHYLSQNLGPYFPFRRYHRRQSAPCPLRTGSYSWYKTEQQSKMAIWVQQNAILLMFGGIGGETLPDPTGKTWPTGAG